MHISERKFSDISTSRKVHIVAAELVEKKAAELAAFDLSQQDSPVEAAVILTASSVRHGQGLADHLLACCREHNIEFLGMEGYAAGQWILLDINDIVVHIFQQETRELFRLADLWPSAPVLLDKRVSKDTV
jgi:ribosome-associated protein